MKSYAPILIPTLNRYAHFQRCIVSLSKCTGAGDTDLIVALDYPLKESHWEGYRLIKDYLLTIGGGFKSLTVIERSENYGAVRNYLESMDYVFSKYKNVVFTEDDNEFSPNFLEFLNAGLSAFESDARVQAVCGYKLPINDHLIKNKEERHFFFAKTFSAWGYATWRDRYLNRRKLMSSLEVYEYLFKKNNSRDIYSMAPKKVLSLLANIKNKKELYGDSIFSLDNIENGTYCLFPTLSKVRNFGHDGSGANCGVVKDSIHQRTVVDERSTIDIVHRVRDDFDCNYAKLIASYYKLSIRDYASIPHLLISACFRVRR